MIYFALVRVAKKIGNRYNLNKLYDLKREICKKAVKYYVAVY